MRGFPLTVANAGVYTNVMCYLLPDGSTQMREKLKKVWHDPVWSKVIATGIAGGIVALWAISSGSGSRFWGLVVPLWLVVVISVGAFIVSILILSKLLRATYGFEPQLKLMGVRVTDPNPNQALSFPVKCYFQFRNDSPGCIDVSVSDYMAQAVTLKSLPMGVLQVQYHQQWLPGDQGMPRVAASVIT